MGLLPVSDFSNGLSQEESESEYLSIAFTKTANTTFVKHSWAQIHICENVHNPNSQVKISNHHGTLILANTLRRSLSESFSIEMTLKLIWWTRWSVVRLVLKIFKLKPFFPGCAKCWGLSPNVCFSTLEDRKLFPEENSGSTWKKPCCPHLF